MMAQRSILQWNAKMDKSDFQADTRYTITWQRPDGRIVPATFYVHKIHDSAMIVRFSGADAALRKIGYVEVQKIVAAETVPPEQRRSVPAALLDESTWRDRSEMAHYASSAARGK
ncbi:MAG: hypothetical protein Q8L65_11955 [Burkholderiales bacterium]|nr:hypothetical protein [Burkholderiales bacterium]MDP2399617.1 hypothetical protein [Burkholderiales bacterium]